MSGLNRPFKYGQRDRREYIVEDAEVALRAINDANGNPTYLGRAKIGVLDDEAKWQIRFITYDANQGVLSVEWPQNAYGNASSEYEFVWDDVLTYTYS